MALDPREKILLTILKKPLNASADIDAMAAYVEALWSGDGDAQTLEGLVQRTNFIEQIETFASIVPSANVDRLTGVVAVIAVIAVIEA